MSLNRNIWFWKINKTFKRLNCYKHFSHWVMNFKNLYENAFTRSIALGLISVSYLKQSTRILRREALTVSGKNSSEHRHSFFLMMAISDSTSLSKSSLFLPAAASLLSNSCSQHSLSVKSSTSVHANYQTSEWTAAFFLSSRHSGAM